MQIEDTTLYTVMWSGPLHGRLLELWEKEETAKDRSREYNNAIAKGKSPILHKIDLSMGIRESTSVEPITVNKKYKIKPEIS